MNLREGRIGVREGISIAAIAMCTSGLFAFDTKNTCACGSAAYITLPAGGIIAIVFFIIVLAAMRRSGAKNLSELILSAFGGTIGTAVTLVLMLCLLAAQRVHPSDARLVFRRHRLRQTCNVCASDGAFCCMARF